MRLVAMTIGLLAAAASACSDPGPSPPEASVVNPCGDRVTVFLDTGIAEPRRRRVGRIIADRPEVTELSFAPAARAFEDFKELYEDRPEFYEDLRRSDFPATYSVTLDDPASFDGFEVSLTGVTGIDKLVQKICSPGPSSPGSGS